MAVGKKREHSALIKQWADGAVIEIRLEQGGVKLDLWRVNDVPQWIPNREYRVQPDLEEK